MEEVRERGECRSLGLTSLDEHSVPRSYSGSRVRAGSCSSHLGNARFVADDSPTSTSRSSFPPWHSFSSIPRVPTARMNSTSRPTHAAPTLLKNSLPLAADVTRSLPLYLRLYSTVQQNETRIQCLAFNFRSRIADIHF